MRSDEQYGISLLTLFGEVRSDEAIPLVVVADIICLKCLANRLGDAASSDGFAALLPTGFHHFFQFIVATPLKRWDVSLLTPFLTTIQTPNEDRHGFICRPGLHFIIARLRFPTAATLEHVRTLFVRALQHRIFSF